MNDTQPAPSSTAPPPSETTGFVHKAESLFTRLMAKLRCTFKPCSAEKTPATDPGEPPTVAAAAQDANSTPESIKS